MGAMGSGIFENDGAGDFVVRLRDAGQAAVGDLISAALRAVAQSEGSLEIEEVQQALAALALLLAEFDPAVLDGAPDQEDLAAWFEDLEIELNPARRQVAGAAISRILLPDDNKWYELWNESDDLAGALAAVHRLRDLLADSASEE